MNKQLIIVLSIALVIILLAIYFFVIRDKKNPSVVIGTGNSNASSGGVSGASVAKPDNTSISGNDKPPITDVVSNVNSTVKPKPTVVDNYNAMLALAGNYIYANKNNVAVNNTFGQLVKVYQKDQKIGFAKTDLQTAQRYSKGLIEIDSNDIFTPNRLVKISDVYGK